jgi:eukaryotic-like serine/threonine-protein kinase
MAEQASTWERVKLVLAAALELPEPEQDSFVRSRCGEDASLRQEVQSLLAASRSSHAMLVPETDAWMGAAEGRTMFAQGDALGEYTIERMLAEGPAAVVYLARQGSTARRVAVKVYRAGLPLTVGADRFRIEAAAAARVEHPNVARLYEAGVFHTRQGARLPYLAMEFVAGPTITEYAKAEALGIEGIVKLMIRVCAGVQAIHQRAVIHRDLKPSNILVDAAGEPKVLDFGVARLGAAGDVSWRTGDGAVLGTPGYMSPEQAERPGDVDVRTDVWALGVVTYELIAGRPPFDLTGMSALQALRHAASTDPRPLPEAARRASGGDLSRVVLKAMAREATARYATAQAFADDLIAVLSGRPVTARRLTLAYRAATLTRRRAVPIGVAAALVVVSVAAAWSQIAAWRRAGQERDRAVAIVDLLQGMISSASPDFGNRDVRMLDALRGIESRIDAGAVEQPIVEADVRSLLARLKFALGEYDRAGAHVERALALRRRHDAADTERIVTDRALLANVLRWRYLPEQARQEASGAVAEGTQRLGRHHPATLDAREALAGTLQDDGDLAQAERQFRAIVAERQRLHDRDDERTLVTKASLASVLADQANYKHAEAIYREVMAGWGAGGQTLEALTVRANLARVVGEQGRIDEAIALLVELAADSRRALGAMHETTLTARTNLLEFLRRRGRGDEALQASAELLTECVGELGWGHERTLSAYTGHVTQLLKVGRAAEAYTLALRAWSGAQTSLPADSPWRARVRASLAAAIAAEGRFAEAIAMYREAIDTLGASLGPRHRITLQSRNNLGVALTDSGDPVSAITELEKTLGAIVDAGYVEMEGTVRRNLGRALVEGGRNEGIEMLAAAYELSIRRQEFDNAARSARLLHEALLRRGAPEAETWRARADDAAAGR